LSFLYFHRRHNLLVQKLIASNKLLPLLFAF
jgi:hypothetical protein